MELDGQELEQFKNICVPRFNGDSNSTIRKGGKRSDNKNNMGIVQTEDYLEKQKTQDEDGTNQPIRSLLISMLYACKAWTLNTHLEKHILAVENSCDKHCCRCIMPGVNYPTFVVSRVICRITPKSCQCTPDLLKLLSFVVQTNSTKL